MVFAAHKRVLVGRATGNKTYDKYQKGAMQRFLYQFSNFNAKISN